MRRLLLLAFSERRIRSRLTRRFSLGFNIGRLWRPKATISNIFDSVENID
jgi:hypothetical protein